GRHLYDSSADRLHCYGSHQWLPLRPLWSPSFLDGWHGDAGAWLPRTDLAAGELQLSALCRAALHPGLWFRLVRLAQHEFDHERSSIISGGSVCLRKRGLWSTLQTVAVIPKNKMASCLNLNVGVNSGSSIFSLHC